MIWLHNLTLRRKSNSVLASTKYRDVFAISSSVKQVPTNDWTASSSISSAGLFPLDDVDIVATMYCDLIDVSKEVESRCSKLQNLWLIGKEAGNQAKVREGLPCLQFAFSSPF